MACRWPTLRYRSASVTGGGKIDAAGGDKTTDALGNAGVFVDLGPTQGDQIFTGTVGGLTQEFDGYVRRLPAIKTGGVVNAAPPSRWAGTGSRDRTSRSSAAISPTPHLVESTPSLPVSLGQVSVSFDGGGKSLPGHFHFVSPGQINVQIPWEFQGQSSVQMKVTLYGYLWGSSVHGAAGHLFAGNLRRHGRRQQCA